MIIFSSTNIKRSLSVAGIIGFFLLALILLFSVSIIYSTKGYIYEDITQVPQADAALVLGAAILKNGELSPVLRDRANKAIELYNAGKVKKIIASGDNSTVTYNEVQPIRKYLLRYNIPESDIFMDYAGFDTYSSIYRAQNIFLVQSLIVVSQSFHLPRAVYIARHLDIDAYGMSADDGRYKLINYFREVLADTKAVIDIAFDRKPKYLGRQIPITEDGRKTLP